MCDTKASFTQFPIFTFKSSSQLHNTFNLHGLLVLKLQIFKIDMCSYEYHSVGFPFKIIIILSIKIMSTKKLATKIFPVCICKKSLVRVT